MHKHVKAFVNFKQVTAFGVNPLPGSGEYPKIEYTPGNVFLVDQIVMGSARTKSDNKLFNLKGNSVQQMRYLKCNDEKDVKILIPLVHAGEFVEILPSPLGNGRMSINSDGLISTQKFPSVVRYISGKNRPRLTSFSGFFTLLDSFEETTIFGCVIDPQGFTLLEIPVSSPLTFHLALNMHDLTSIPAVRAANRTCDLKCLPFVRDLKFKYKFAQRISQIRGKRFGADNEGDPGEPASAANSARFGVTTTYLYL